jgi:hypothetical protein
LAVTVDLANREKIPYDDEGRGHPVYRWAVGDGGVLYVLETPDGKGIGESSIAAAYGPTAWAAVTGISFGDFSSKLTSQFV